LYVPLLGVALAGGVWSGGSVMRRQGVVGGNQAHVPLLGPRTLHNHHIHNNYNITTTTMTTMMMMMMMMILMIIVTWDL
jgi:hypothetical protein